ncbi:MAG: trypsin-like peptidase domain-containing protein [Syntrophomonas sp.]|nr:trypsin-like peptidase domain-containing protein [Syntrophomonas sp.]
MKISNMRGIKIFLICFCLGLGTFIFFNSLTGPSKKVINDEQGVPAIGSVSNVASKVSPSIVGVSSLRRNGDMFNQRSSEATGSGVIWDKEGHIVTNYHVVEGADRLVVSLVDGNQEEATVVATDPRTDLAVIKIKVDRKVTPAKFGNSDKLVVGQQVVAIGNPLGLRFARSVTSGVVSGLNRIITSEEGFVFHLIQTDAAINPGNSGGALVDLSGQVVGINTIKIAVPGFEGMGFSIPSKQVGMVVNDLLKNGRVLRPIMGIKILGEISPDEASYYNLPVSNGVVVIPVPGGPADQVGIKENDIVTKINGEPVENGQELQEKIFASKIGDEIELQIVRIVRQGSTQIENLTIKVKLGQDQS